MTRHMRRYESTKARVHYGCQTTAVAKKCCSVWIIFCEIFQIYFTQTNKPKKNCGRTNPDCVVRAVLILTQQKFYCFKAEPKHVFQIEKGKNFKCLYSTGRFQWQQLIKNLLKKAGGQNVSTLWFLIMFYRQTCQ